MRNSCAHCNACCRNKKAVTYIETKSVETTFQQLTWKNKAAAMTALGVIKKHVLEQKAGFVTARAGKGAASAAAASSAASGSGSGMSASPSLSSSAIDSDNDEPMTQRRGSADSGGRGASAASPGAGAGSQSPAMFDSPPGRAVSAGAGGSGSSRTPSPSVEFARPLPRSALTGGGDSSAAARALSALAAAAPSASAAASTSQRQSLPPALPHAPSFVLSSTTAHILVLPWFWLDPHDVFKGVDYKADKKPRVIVQGSFRCLALGNDVLSAAVEDILSDLGSSKDFSKLALTGPAAGFCVFTPPQVFSMPGDSKQLNEIRPVTGIGVLVAVSRGDASAPSLVTQVGSVAMPKVTLVLSFWFPLQLTLGCVCSRRCTANA